MTESFRATRVQMLLFKAAWRTRADDISIDTSVCMSCVEMMSRIIAQPSLRNEYAHLRFNLSTATPFVVTVVI